MATVNQSSILARYGAEVLPNGFIHIRDYASGLQGLLERDGRARSGDLAGLLSEATRVALAATAIVAAAEPSR